MTHSHIKARPQNKPMLQTSPNDVVDGFFGGCITASGKTIPYRLFVPELRTTLKQAPMTVFFHGMGSIGSDNRAQLELAGRFSRAAQSRHPCFVLAPQCPKDARWVKAEWSHEQHVFQAEPTWPMALAITLIDHILQIYPIDPTRLYVGGASMGGFATWDILARCPGKFAAAFPICGGGDSSTVSRMASVCIWSFHGAQDASVPVSASRNMIEALRAAGVNPHYTEYPDIQHDAWNPALSTPELYDWLFKNHTSNEGENHDQ